MLGLAGYGRSMKLSDPTCVTDGCPVNGKWISDTDINYLVLCHIQ